MIPIRRKLQLAARMFFLIATGTTDLRAAEIRSEMPQRELLLFEEPLVTAAAKHPQLAQDAPSAVTVITREEIRRFGYRTLAEVLRSVRGFYGSYDRNYSYIGVRGFLRPGDYNDRILLLVNGHTYNDDVFQTAYLGPEFGIDLEAVERIEVIRGPGSALYGGNALFAVINVVTATGDERPGVRALVETGSFERKRGQITVGHVFGNGLTLLAAGSVLDLAGNRELFYSEFASPETRNGIARDADAERALNFFLTMQYGSFTLQGGANTREKHVPTGSFGTAFGDPDTKTVDGRQFAELLYTTELAAKVLTTARVYYDGVRYHGTYIIGSGEDRTKNEDLAPSHWVGGEVRAQRQMFQSHALTVGTEYTYHPEARQENFDVGGERFLDDRRAFGTLGVYGQDEWTIAPKVTLVGGLRFDRYYDRLEQLSPRAAAIWSPLVFTRVKLLYGRAFRAPNLFEQYYASPAGLGLLANPDIDPERISTYEAVLEQEVWLRAQVVASVYHYEIEDLIDQTVVGEDLLQFRNLSSARATGGELEIRMPLPHGGTARAAYSHQDARAKGGRRLTNSPRHLGDLAVLFPLPYGLDAGAELIVVGPRLTLAGRSLDPVTLANLNLVSRTLIPNLEVSAGFYNVLNQPYSDPGGAEHRQDRLRQDRFTFRVSLRYEF